MRGSSCAPSRMLARCRVAGTRWRIYLFEQQAFFCIYLQITMFGGGSSVDKLTADLQRRNVKIDQLESTINKLNTDLAAAKKDVLDLRKASAEMAWTRGIPCGLNKSPEPHPRVSAGKNHQGGKIPRIGGCQREDDQRLEATQPGSNDIRQPPRCLEAGAEQPPDEGGLVHTGRMHQKSALHTAT